MEYYWELIQHDGTRVEIPPSAVEVVKRRWTNGDAVHLSTMSIPANQIKTFRQTSKLFSERPLLEAAAQAFNEPIITESGAVQARWVKKEVTSNEWSKHFSAIPSYRRLGDENGMVVIAFRLPTHQVDPAKVAYCSDDEVAKLTQ